MLKLLKATRNFQISLKNTKPNLKIERTKNFSTDAKEQTVNVAGQTINYVEVGNGATSVLCFPGALGSIWTDFRPQVEGLDRSKFTVVAWDPPGYGRSVPPPRKFSADFYHTDAEAAKTFMKVIGVEKFSLIGWSDGGISSMILAAKYPEVVEKLVIFGSNAYVLSEEIKIYESIRDTKKWSARMRQPMIDLYGEEGFQKLWNDWCDALQEINNQGGNICKDLLPSIKCPTFVLHGKKDPMIAPEHPDYLLKHIKNAKFYVFDEGKHNIHLRYAKEFNDIVSKFLLE